jgi:hypothetical protein
VITVRVRLLLALGLVAIVITSLFLVLRDANVRTLEHLDGYQRTGDTRKIVVSATIGIAVDVIEASAHEDAASVTVRVRVRPRPGTYPSIGVWVPVVVELRDPLGERTVLDPSHDAVRDLGMYRPEFRGPPDATTGVFFPVLQPASAIPLALIQGRVVQRGGCLWLQGAEGQPLYLALWSPGSRLEASGSTIAVVDPAGARIGVGDRLRATGGETKNVEDVIALTGQKPPLACQTGEGYVRLYQITKLP